MEFLDDWVLTLITFIPLVGAVLVMMIPKTEEQLIKATALIATLVVAALGVWLLIDFDYGAAGQLQYVVDEKWIEVINSRYILGIDGISFPLILLTMLIVPLC
ncbi:MAG: NADH-quinone oxidoreductase subunit M, partial [Acidimicrobiia bacterium]|nr:NADH-quinone oxidoreductase subunit M [Acidimicrobiia bacterium]